MKHILIATSLIASTLCFPATTRAAFILIDNFQSYGGATILPAQGNWVAMASNSGSTVLDDAGEKAGQFTSGDTGSRIYNNAAALTVANADTGTLFFQLTLGNIASTDLSIGLSDVAAPAGAVGAFGDFEAQISLTSAGIRVRNGGAFTSSTALANNVTYNLWLVSNNSANTSTLYIQGGAFLTQTAVQTDFAFRNGAASNSLQSFLVLGGGGGAGTIKLDNLHMDASSSNLANPVVPEPSVFGLLAFAGAALLMSRKRGSRGF